MLCVLPTTCARPPTTQRMLRFPELNRALKKYYDGEKMNVMTPTPLAEAAIKLATATISMLLLDATCHFGGHHHRQVPANESYPALLLPRHILKRNAKNVCHVLVHKSTFDCRKQAATLLAKYMHCFSCIFTKCERIRNA